MGKTEYLQNWEVGQFYVPSGFDVWCAWYYPANLFSAVKKTKTLKFAKKLYPLNYLP